MDGKALGTNISNRYDRATNILRSLQPGIPFNLSQRIRLRRLRQSSQVLNKSASHLAYILALKEELKMGIEEDQQSWSSPENMLADGELGQAKSHEGARNRSKTVESPPPKRKSRWRMYTPNSPSARKAWLMKQERRYGALDTTRKTEPEHGSLENNVHEDRIADVSERRRGFHSALIPIPVEKRGSKYLKHTMSLYKNGEPGSGLSANKEEDDVAKENEKNEEYDGIRKDDGECLEIRPKRHPASPLPSRDSESLNDGEPPEILSIESGEGIDAKIEQNVIFEKDTESGLVIIWNSFKSKSGTPKLLDPDEKTTFEYHNSTPSSTSKERRRTILHLDNSTAIEGASKSLPANYSTATKQRPRQPSEGQTYVTSDPNPFQKPLRLSAVLPSSQRSGLQSAPVVKSLTGYPTSQVQFDDHRATGKQRSPDQKSQFLENLSTIETAGRPPPNYSRPLIPKRTGAYDMQRRA